MFPWLSVDYTSANYSLRCHARKQESQQKWLELPADRARFPPARTTTKSKHSYLLFCMHHIGVLN